MITAIVIVVAPCGEIDFSMQVVCLGMLYSFVNTYLMSCLIAEENWGADGWAGPTYVA